MFAGPPTCTVDAPAKINLTLEILGRRPDGYHELRSVVVPLSLADTITLSLEGEAAMVTAEPGLGIDLSRLGPAGENLAVRAVRLFQARYGVPAGVRIHILKRIPIGGGLGGGSADAAAVLCGLNRLCRLELPLADLAELGAALGSDVPALLHGGAVCMEGRGERIRPLLERGGAPPSGFWVVVANPGICIPTRDAYRRCSAMAGLTGKADILHIMTSSVRSGDVTRAASALFNGLENGVFAAYPETARLAARLRDAGSVGVLLSGSGASVFALVRDAAHGEAVCRHLGAGTWSVLTRTLPDGVMAAHGPLEP